MASPILLLASFSLVLAGVHGCETSLDCNMAGVCSPATGVCECEPAWRGEACEVLNLAPAKPGGGFNAALAYGQCVSTDNCTSYAGSWGSSLIQDGNGLFHMFVNVMSGLCPWIIFDWGANATNASPCLLGTNSHVVHVTADSAEGPYMEVRDVVLPNVANNPLVVRPSGSSGAGGPYFLYYEGLPLAALNRTAPVCNGTNRCLGDCSNHAASDLNPGPLSVAVADTLEGPWRVVDLQLLENRSGMFDFGVDLVNPAAYIFPNQTTLLVYRTATHYFYPNSTLDWSVGVAVGPSPTGPFTQPTAPAFPEHAEDPVLWRDRNGVFQMLVHNCSGVGPPQGGFGKFHCLAASGSAWSTDGLQWTVRGPPPFPYTQDFTDGSSIQCDRREEPKLLFDGDGQPTHLATTCAFTNFTTRVLVQPFAPGVALKKKKKKTRPFEVTGNIYSSVCPIGVRYPIV